MESGEFATETNFCFSIFFAAQFIAHGCQVFQKSKSRDISHIIFIIHFTKNEDFHLLKKSIMENFIFFAVINHIWIWKNFEIILLDTVLFVIYENFRIRNGLKINHLETALF